MNSFSSTLSQSRQTFHTARASEPIFAYRFSLLGFLAQIFFCIVPAALLLGTGHTEMAGKTFWLLLVLVLFRGMLLKRRDEMLCFVLGTAPFISLLRGYIFYNIIIVTFAVVLGFYYLVGSTPILETLRRFPLFWAVPIWVTGYYLLSFYNTQDYSINLRQFELTFTIFFILLLSRNRVLLGSALLGTTISACMVGLAMLPQIGESQRLGIMEADGHSLGNPGQLGIPLAFGFLALIFDRGRWTHLEAHPFWRWAMVAPAVILLALTTSRASWLVAATGIAVLFLFGHQQRSKIILVAAVGFLAIAAIMASPYSAFLKKGWDRTFGEGASTRKKTSGRSDQWLVARYAFTRSIQSIVHGYGPGMGPATYAKLSPEVPDAKYGVGRKVALHSLFMQVTVETGAIGLLLLSGWLVVVFMKVQRHRRGPGIFCFACFLGYLFTVITISGSDINSGVLLGLSLLGTANSRV